MNHMFKNKILSARRACRLDCSYDEYMDSPRIVKCASQEAKAAPKHNPLLPPQIWEAQPSALCMNPLKKHLQSVRAKRHRDTSHISQAQLKSSTSRTELQYYVS